MLWIKYTCNCNIKPKFSWIVFILHFNFCRTDESQKVGLKDRQTGQIIMPFTTSLPGVHFVSKQNIIKGGHSTASYILVFYTTPILSQMAFE